MIAASEPQEFIPSGRQQVLKHPGLQKTKYEYDDDTDNNRGLDTLILHRLKHVSITEEDTNPSNQQSQSSAEWWCVRECNHFTGTDTDKKSDDTYFHLDKKLDTDKFYVDSLNDSWSWKTIDPNVGVGSVNVSAKPSNSNTNTNNKSRFSGDSDYWKNDSKSTRQAASKPNKLICKNEICSIEEELYVKGCTAVWSRGLLSTTTNLRTTVCSYTMEKPIKHALWCTFYLERPTFSPLSSETTNEKLEQPNGKPLACICLIDACNMKVFTVNSEDFTVSLPFQVSNVWTTKFGILLEKQQNADDLNSTSNFYSLNHPLDDFCPVALKNLSIQLLNNSALKIVFSVCEPSICLVYDTGSGLHSVYRLRKIKSHEFDFSVSKIKLCNTNNSLHSSIAASISNKVKNNLSIWSGGGHGHGTGLPLATGSPYSSRATSLSNLVSPYHSRSHSPIMATISRCQSPSISPLVSGSSWINNRSTYYHNDESSAFATTTATATATTTQFEQSFQMKQMNPELCLEHVWTENQSKNICFASNSSASSKAFLSTDLVGQNYLCYLIPNKSQLNLVRMDSSNDNLLIFGTNYSLNAKDAVVVPSLHMIAILEPNGHIMLYSGPTQIGKVHIGGVSAEFSNSISTNLTVSAGAGAASPFPRRSSLLPHCGTPMSIPKFDEHLISPVYPPVYPPNNHKPLFISGNTTNSVISAIRDAVCDRITLQYSDNTYYRVCLPALASGTLVECCLNALRQSLQRDVALTVFGKWYAIRNAPGPADLTVEQEWQLFISLIYDLLGYGLLTSTEFISTSISNDEIKRQRPSPQGTNVHWEEMFHTTNCDINNLLNLNKNLNKQPIKQPENTKSHHHQINQQSILFPYFRLVLFTLHLLYEELKLNTVRMCELSFLAKFLHQLASDLRLEHWVLYYWKDFPEHCSFRDSTSTHEISDSDFIKIHPLNVMTTEPVNIMQYFCELLIRGDVPQKPYPFIKLVNPFSKNMLQICGMITAGRFNRNCADFDINSLVKNFAPPGSRIDTDATAPSSALDYQRSSSSWPEKIVMFMTDIGLTRRSLDSIPAALNLLLHEALWQCRENPPTDWTSDSYYLLQRPDLAVQAEADQKCTHKLQHTQLRDILPTIKHYDPELEDGMEDVESALLKLRFPDDHRITEVRRLLQSSEPVYIGVAQRPDVSDHDFIEEQEKHLYAICTRTMALPIGRGMFTMRTATPVVTEPLPVPRLCLSGKAPPRGASVDLTHIDTPPNMNMWPLFHNGVAAGLRISTDASDIDSNWIVFNKPKSTAETPMEHAGFLMALGLNGHLKNLAIMNMYEYLIQFREMTSVGLLLGLSATKRATMDTSTTKMLSIHIEALLPPTSMELDIPQNIQVAALLGIGLVYEGSAHRHMTEVLLSEIGRPPGPEMENSVDRESYSLAAGLALGLVTLKQGGRPSGFADLGVPDTLHYYMVGGNKRTLTGAQKDKYKVASFQIREGSTVNLDVTAPGATLALALMYLGSGNKAIADWMKPPDTQYLLDFVRPDFLMLRIIARALVLWDDIRANVDWVDGQVPAAIRPFCLEKPNNDIEIDIDYESMNQVYCNIIAGACFAIGLKYAGTADENAFQTLYHYCRMFTSLTGKSIAELAGKPTIETCLNLILLSIGMVMAGTGRLQVLRLCRHLRKRVGVSSSSVVTYGSHVATHMTLGLLFLGGGRYTLSNSPASVAVMLCAFFPKFPTHSNDNRYHLQAFRHLYVLAVEPRLLVPRDVLTGRMCYANLSMVQLDGNVTSMRAPCLLPDLNQLATVSIQDQRYWPVVFERGRNWEQLQILLDTCGHVEVKQRAGCLSYLEDPFGSRSLLARSLTQANNMPWTPLPNAINSFSSEPTVKYFTDYFLTPKRNVDNSLQEQSLRQAITMAMYECVTKDKLAVLPMWIVFIKTIQSFNKTPKVIQAWQLKLLFALVLSHPNKKSLISSEVALSMQQKIIEILETWQTQLNNELICYLNGHGEQLKGLSVYNEIKLANIVSFFDIPFNVNINDRNHFLEIYYQLLNRDLSAPTINKIIDIVSDNNKE